MYNSKNNHLVIKLLCKDPCLLPALMSLLNVLRGSQSLPLTTSSVSIAEEGGDSLNDDKTIITYFYYQNDSECTIEQVLISVRRESWLMLVN